MIASSYVWLNDEIVPRQQADPSVASNTLNLGTAVFDGIMAYWNRDHWLVHRGGEHVRRFLDGSRKMGLDQSWTESDLLTGIDRLLDTLPPRTHYLRPLAYRRSAEVFFHVTDEQRSTCVFAVPARRDVDAPLSCELSPVQRVHHRAIPVGWKISGAYANSYLAEEHARSAGFDTGLMLDRVGRIAETSSSNVFFVQDGELITPRLDGDVFPGITRRLVLELARADGVAVRERDVRPEELSGFEGAMLCGTLSEIRWIDRIGEHCYGSAPHPLVKQLTHRFRTITHA